MPCVLRFGLVLSVVMACSAAPASAQCYDQLMRASDGDNIDSLGTAVAISGDIAIAGAWLDLGGGSAYIFAHNGSQWIEAQKITPTGGASFFGTDVAIDGDHAAVASQGKMFFFQFDGSTWVQRDVYTIPDGGETLFPTVAIEGEIAVVGAEWSNARGSDSGEGYVLAFDGSSWVEQQVLAPGDLAPNDFFGCDVDIDGGRILIGANGRGSTFGGGGAYTFVNDGSGWIPEDRLDAPNNDLRNLGLAVALEGSQIVLGAPDTEVGFAFEGAAVAYAFNGVRWQPQQQLTADPPVASEHFGSSVAIGDGHLIVGARGRSGGNFDLGSAYLFAHDGASWQPVERLHRLGAEPADFIGDVDVAGPHVMVGNEGFEDRRTGSSVGAVHFFDRDCQPCLDLEISNFVVGQTATFEVSGGTPGADAIIVFGRVSGTTSLNNFNGFCARLGIKDLERTSLVGGGVQQFDATGTIRIDVNIPPGHEERTFFFQAAQRDTCPAECMSKVRMKTLPR